MQKTAVVRVKPHILEWVRNRAGLVPEALAKKIGVSCEKVMAWENGDGHPTLKQAEKIAKSTYIPFGYLFLEQPKEDELGIADFRTPPGKSSVATSLELLDTVRQCRRQQAWYRDYIITECGNSPLSCFPDSSTDDESKIAKNIRGFFDWQKVQYKKGINAEGFLRECIASAHNKGFLIARNGRFGDNSYRPLDPNEFRGFALFDEFAPLVFINSRRDSEHAQLFTLAHELAHLFRGKSGVDAATWEHTHTDNKEEAICNRIAANALMPHADFVSLWQGTFGNEWEKIKGVSATFKVSNMAAAIRARETGCISQDSCESICTHEKEKFAARQQKQRDGDSKGGPDYWNTLFNRLPGGKNFAHAVVSSAQGGDLRYPDAFSLLGVSAKSFNSCASRIRK